MQQVVIKLTAPDVSLVMQAGLRSLGATALVGIWILLHGRPIWIRDGTLWWGIAAGVLFGLEFLLIYWGLEFTHASRAVIFIYLAPFVVAIGGQLFLPGERLSAIQFAGLGLAFMGIAVAFGESFTLPSRRMLIGDAMLVAAAISWGATTVLIKAGPLANADASRTLIYQLAVSAVILIPSSWLLGEPGIVELSTFAIGSLLFQTAWIAFATYLVWFWLIRYYPASKLASFTFVTPLFGVFAGWWILQEPLTPALSIAAALVATGIYLVNRRQSRRQQETVHHH